MSSIVDRSNTALGPNAGATGAIDSTGANLLVLLLHWYNGGATLAIDVADLADSKGNTNWQECTLHNNLTGAIGTRIFYCLNPASVGAGHTITITANETYSVAQFIAANVTGGSGNVILFGENGATGVAPIATGNVNALHADAVAIAGCNGNTSSSFAASNGFNLQSFAYGAGNNMAGAGGYLIPGATGNVSTTFTLSAAMQSAAAIAVFGPLSVNPGITSGIALADDTSIRVSNTAATPSGDAPFDYQFQRAPDVAGAPGTFVDIGASQDDLTSGIAPDDYDDTGLINGTTYWFRCKVTDSSAAEHLTEPVAVVCDFIDTSNQVEIVGTKIESAGATGDAFDEDLDTYWEGADVECWLGVTVDDPVMAVAALLAPAFGDIAGDNEFDIVGGVFEASNDGFVADIVTIYTIPAFPFLPAHHLHEITWSARVTRTDWRLRLPNGTKIAGLHFLAVAGATIDARPIAPVIAPWGGNHTSGSALVTLTNRNAGTESYYTIDTVGDPIETDTQWVVPFTLTVAEDTVLRAINYDATLDNPYSRTKTATFHNFAFRPGADPPDDEYDDRGALVEAHNCDIKWYANIGLYIKIGTSCHLFSDVNPFGGGRDANGITGLNMYSSPNMLPPWTFIANFLPTPSGWLHILRPHLLANELNNNSIVWAYGFTNPDTLACVGRSPDADPRVMPWEWVHIGIDPNGTGSFGDCNVWENAARTKAYVEYRSGIVPGKLIISELNADYDNVLDAGTYKVLGATFAEAPILYDNSEGNVWVSLSTGVGNYYDHLSTFHHQYQTCNSSDPITGEWSTPRPVFSYENFDILVGTPFNGQFTCAIKRPGDRGPIIVMDRWIQDSMVDTRTKYFPASHLLIDTPTEFDPDTYFNPSIPFNDRDVGLQWYSALGGFGNAIEIVAGNNLVENGTVFPTGVNQHGRMYQTAGTDKLIAPNDASNQLSDVKFMVRIWVQRGQASGTTAGIFHKDGAGGTQMGALGQIDGSIKSYIAGAECVSRVIAEYEEVMLTMYHDPIANTVTQWINDESPPVVTALIGGPTPSTEPVVLPHDFRVTFGDTRHFGIWVGIDAPDTTEMTRDYNNGIPIPPEFFGYQGYDATFTLTHSGATFGADLEFEAADINFAIVVSHSGATSEFLFVAAGVSAADLIDTFDGVAGTRINFHVSDSNHLWRIITAFDDLFLSGAGSIYSTESSGTSVIILSNRVPASVNQYTEITHREHSHLNQGYAALLRASTADGTHNTLTAYDIFRIEGSIVIGKYVNGVYSVLASTASAPGFDDGNLLRAITIGTNPVEIRVEVNSIQYLSYSDSSSPISVVGVPGIRYYSDEVGSPTTGHHIGYVFSSDLIAYNAAIVTAHSGATGTASFTSAAPGFNSAIAALHSGAAGVIISTFAPVGEFTSSITVSHSGTTFSGSGTTSLPTFISDVVVTHSGALSTFNLSFTAAGEFGFDVAVIFPSAVFVGDVEVEFPANYVDTIYSDVCFDYIISEAEIIV